MTDSPITFHGDDVPQGNPETSLFHIIPVPYEKSVSYGSGTAEGPEAIIEASCQLEVFDGKSLPAKYGIYTAPAVDCDGSHEEALQNVKTAVEVCLAAGKMPVVLGGEHTVTGGVADALLERYDSFGVVQFDAHADLRDSYEGSKYSHACVMKRLVDKKIPIYQLGTRSYCLDEHQLRLHNKIPYMDAEDVHRLGVDAFRLPADFPEKVFITFDIDALDSSIMPATGTPVPGGLTWYQCMWLIESIARQRTVIGFDVLEYAPMEDLHSADFTAAQLVYNMMGIISRSEKTKDYFGI
ncbi:MAG: agmatinase [Deferribacterales bacterium]